MTLTDDDFEVVYFTIRSLGDIWQGQTIQLAAKFDHGGETYFNWITPSKSIARYASKIEGLQVRRGGMFFENHQLPVVSLEFAMSEFLTFLKSSQKPVVIVGHSTQFVFIRLLRAILRTNMIEQFQKVIAGFSDSLPIFKMMLPHWKKSEQFKLSNLVQVFLKEEYEESFLSATNDLKVLEKLVNHCDLKNSLIEKHESCEKALLREMEAEYSVNTVRGLEVMRNYITLGTLNKIAEAGVTYSDMEGVFQREGSQGLADFLSKKQGDGKPNVTNSDDEIQKIVDFFDRKTSQEDGKSVKNKVRSRVNEFENSSFVKKQGFQGKPKQIRVEIVTDKNGKELYEVEYTD